MSRFRIASRTWSLGGATCRQHMTDTLFLLEKRQISWAVSLQDLNDLQYFAQVVATAASPPPSARPAAPSMPIRPVDPLALNASTQCRTVWNPIARIALRRAGNPLADPPTCCRVVIGRSRPRRPPKRNSRGFVLAPRYITVDRLTGLLRQSDGLAGLLLKRQAGSWCA